MKRTIKVFSIGVVVGVVLTKNEDNIKKGFDKLVKKIKPKNDEYYGNVYDEEVVEVDLEEVENE